MPAPLRGRERGRCPHAAFWPTWTVPVPSFVQKLRGSPTRFATWTVLGCCPNPGCAPAVFRSRAHCKSSSLAPLKPLQPNLKPAVSGLFVWTFSAAPAVPGGTGLRPGCALSQMVASSRFWLRPTGSPSKRATSLFRGWAVVISTLAQKRRSGPLMAFAGLLLCGALPRPLGCNGGGGHDSCCCPMLARCLLRVIHRLQWVHFGVDFCAMSLMLSASPDALGQVIHRPQTTHWAGSAGPKTQKAPSLGLR